MDSNSWMRTQSRTPANLNPNIVFLLWAVALAIFLVGFAIKFIDLGKFSFWNDEIYHAIAAQAILESGQPVFPSGNLYERAIGFTRSIALVFSLFGESESNARIISVISHSLLVICCFEFVRRNFSLPAAVAISIFISFTAINLTLARQARMYAPFGLFYFLTVLSIYHFLFIKNEIQFIKQFKFIYALPTVLALYLAYHLHDLALTIVAPIGVFILILGISALSSKGMIKDKIFNPFIFALILAGLMLGGLMVLKPEIIYKTLEKMLFVPNWALARGDLGSDYYFNYFMRYFPLLVFLYIPSSFWIIYKYRKIGLWITLNFIVLFAIHSLVFNWKDLRYIYYIFPFFVMPFCILIGDAFQKILSKSPHTEGMKRKIALLTALVIVSVISLNPWLRVSKYSITQTQYPDWLNIPSQFQPNNIDKDVCTFTTAQNLFYYYSGEIVDYYIRLIPEDSTDSEYFGGGQVIDTDERFINTASNCESVYLITDGMLERETFFNDKMRKYIDSELVEADIPNNRLRIFFRNI